VRHGATPKKCSHEGCTSQVVKGGVCTQHGAQKTRRTCSLIDFEFILGAKKTNESFMANNTKSPSNSISANSGSTPTKHKIRVDENDGPEPKKGRRLCSVIECTNQVQNGGVCRRHGAKVWLMVKTCSHEGCTNYLSRGGVCWTHGAKPTGKA